MPTNNASDIPPSDSITSASTDPSFLTQLEWECLRAAPQILFALALFYLIFRIEQWELEGYARPYGRQFRAPGHCPDKVQPPIINLPTAAPHSPMYYSNQSATRYYNGWASSGHQSPDGLGYGGGHGQGQGAAFDEKDLYG